jgi:hypothetical protein
MRVLLRMAPTWVQGYINKSGDISPILLAWGSGDIQREATSCAVTT